MKTETSRLNERLKSGIKLSTGEIDSAGFKTRPSWVESNIWEGLSPEAKKNVCEIEQAQPPRGVSEEIWSKLDDGTRYEMKSMHKTSLMKQESTGGNCSRFFCGHSEEIEDRAFMESAVNAMAFVSAVLLTIPFGIISLLSSDFFDTIESTLSSCESQPIGRDQPFEFVRKALVNNTAGIVYASLCGLIMTTQYYVFRAPNGMKLSSYQKKKEKALLLAMVGTTTASVTCLMNLATYLFMYYTMQVKNICTDSAFNVWAIGILVVSFSVLLTAYLVN